MIQGATVTYFAYLGFDFVTTLSEDAKDPQRDIPKATVLSVTVCMFFYIMMGFAGYGLV